MNESGKPPYTLENARDDIARLNDERIAQLNRIVATEAMLKTIIAELPLDLLQQMAERYDLRSLNGMEKMLPGHYRAHLWDHYAEKMQEQIALLQGKPPTTPL